MLYKLIDPSSKNCVTTALNIFDTRPTNVAIKDSAYEELLTLNPLDNPPYHFKISPGDGFIDFSKTYLSTTFKLMKKTDGETTWKNIEDSDVVAPIQALGATFIKNVKVLANGREIFNSNNLYSYKSFIDLTLSQTKAVKSSYLQSCGYFEDDKNPSSVAGAGFKNRKKLFLNGSVEFISKLFVDIFSQENFFINNTELDIEIQPNSQDFVLIETPKKDTTYALVVDNCRLFVKKVYIIDTLSQQIAHQLETSPSKYSISKTELKSLFIGTGRYEYVANLFYEQIPRRVIIGLVPHKNYVGSRITSPFTFKNFGVQNMSLQVNGKQYPNILYQLDFDSFNYTRLFHDFYENLGYAGTTESMDISLESFKENSCYFVFNLSSSQDVDSCFDLIKEGTTSVHIRFKEPVPVEGITLIAYCEQDALIMIDKNRTVTSDITV